MRAVERSPSLSSQVPAWVSMKDGAGVFSELNTQQREARPNGVRGISLRTDARHPGGTRDAGTRTVTTLRPIYQRVLGKYTLGCVDGDARHRPKEAPARLSEALRTFLTGKILPRRRFGDEAWRCGFNSGRLRPRALRATAQDVFARHVSRRPLGVQPCQWARTTTRRRAPRILPSSCVPLIHTVT